MDHMSAIRALARIVEAQAGADCSYVSIIARRLCMAVDEASIQTHLSTQLWPIHCHLSCEQIWRTR